MIFEKIFAKHRQPSSIDLDYLRDQLLKVAPRGLRLDESFHQKAQDYLYSDWLFPAVFETQFDLKNEFLLASFPDLSEWVTRDQNSVSISLPEVNKLKLSSFGKILKKHLKNKIAVDIGCGRLNSSFCPRFFSEYFRAAAYFGIDHSEVNTKEMESEFLSSPFRSLFFKMDVFDFFKNFNSAHPLFLFLIGIEDVDLKNRSAGHKLKAEILRQLKKNDFLLIGAGSSLDDWPKTDFKNIYQDNYHLLLRRI